MGGIGETSDVAASHPGDGKRFLAFAEKCRGEFGDSLTKRTGKNALEPRRVAAAAEKSKRIGADSHPALAHDCALPPRLARRLSAPTWCYAPAAPNEGGNY